MHRLYRLTWELSDLASCAARFGQAHGDTAEDRKDWEILSGSRLCIGVRSGRRFAS